MTKRMQGEAILCAVDLKDFEQERSGGFDLEKAATVGRDSRDKIGAQFLRREFHCGRLKNPGLKALRYPSHVFRGLKTPAPSKKIPTSSGA